MPAKPASVWTCDRLIKPGGVSPLALPCQQSQANRPFAQTAPDQGSQPAETDPNSLQGGENKNKNARPASRRRPQGAGNDIRGMETVSSKQQIMKTLSNNYCNENYWGGKGSRQAVCIWLMQLVSGVKHRESARDGRFSFVFDMSV